MERLSLSKLMFTLSYVVYIIIFSYTEPIYTELIELFKGVVSWQTLAAHLLSDKDGSKVKIIEENNHGNVQKCRAEMLQEYFKSGTVSWEVVLEALRKAGEKNTADKIKQKLL